MKTLARLMLPLAFTATLSVGAAPAYNNDGIGGIAFGVASYGGAPPGTPQYIPNNINGIADVLTSPGGTFLTADPSVPNNLLSTPYVATPLYAFLVGGANANGSFGSGSATILGPTVGYGISDPSAGGGSASYGIAHWEMTFTDAAGSPGFGSYLSVKGLLPEVGSAAVVALRTHITTVNNTIGTPFGGAGYDMPQLVLALSQVGVGAYSWVALGGPAGANAAVFWDGVGDFSGLAIDNIAMAIPAGETFKVESTLTFYGDPASLASLDAYVNPDQALIDATGTTLPDSPLISTVPEPGTFALLCLGVFGLLLGRLRRRA